MQDLRYTHPMALNEGNGTKQKLNRIKSGLLSRGMAMTRVAVGAGARVAGTAISTVFANDEEKAEKFKQLLIDNAQRLTSELGQLKGSLMKVGQILSSVGEQFLPPEALKVLKTLQSNSPPLEWREIEKVLINELGAEKLALLEIETEPAASASLGQVHRARRRSDGQLMALKVQYPGVDKAIDGDLKTLKTLLSFASMLPKGPNYDDLFKQVKTVLLQETAYVQEAQATRDFGRWLASDARYRVPEVFDEFSTRRVLATSWEDGLAVDSPEVAALSQERRNGLCEAFMDLYFRELFEFKAIQSDAHFGNYRVRLGADGASDQLVLFDFGAVGKFTDEFLNSYSEMTAGIFFGDADQVKRGGKLLGFVRDSDAPEMSDKFGGF